MADANIFVAAFLKDSTVRRIITLPGLQLLVPEYLFEEIDRHLPHLRRKAGLGKREADELAKHLGKYFIVLNRETFSEKLGEAARIMRAIDPRDAVYVAMALSISCDGIWSDDPHLKRQNRVRCFTTKELLVELKAAGLSL